MAQTDPYEVLGIPRDTPAEEVKKAYRKAAFDTHPDRNPDNPWAEERFKDVNQAYSTLSDPFKRAEFDLSWKRNKQQAPNSNFDFGTRSDFAGQRNYRYSSSGPSWQGNAYEANASASRKRARSRTYGFRSASAWLFIIALSIVGVLLSYGTIYSLLMNRGEHDALKPFIRNWQMAWQDTAHTKSVADYRQFYSQSFKTGKDDLSKWMRRRLRNAKGAKEIRVEVSNIKVEQKFDNIAQVSFDQSYKKDRHHDFGRKTLWLQKEAGLWKIIREEWKPI